MKAVPALFLWLSLGSGIALMVEARLQERCGYGLDVSEALANAVLGPPMFVAAGAMDLFGDLPSVGQTPCARQMDSVPPVNDKIVCRSQTANFDTQTGAARQMDKKERG